MHKFILFYIVLDTKNILNRLEEVKKEDFFNIQLRFAQYFSSQY